MQTKRIFSLVLFAALSGTILFAQQEEKPKPAAPPQADFMKMRKSPVMQQSMRMGMKTGLRSFWDGRGANLMAIQLLAEPDIRKAWDVSDEQYQQIQNVQKNMQGNFLKNPEFLKIMEEMKAIQKPDDPMMQNADEETKKKFQNIQERIMSLAINGMADEVDKLLTPEQKRKMQEFQLSSMSEIPVLSPNMFEALDLTDAQKQKMEGVKKELEPEFEKNLDDFADAQQIAADKIFDELEKQGGADFKDQKALQEKVQAIGKKLAAEDPEYKRIQDDLMGKGKLFSTRFKMKMFDVLTDEQWARLQNLTDHPPEYIAAYLKKMKERFGGGESSGNWQPGADSWKPGEAIPEEYRQKRKPSAFPRQEN